MKNIKSMISIIIPCRNEAKFIDRCLKSVYSFNSVPGNCEVIVVDGMSEDGTRDILAKWRRWNPNMMILNNVKRIVPTAMNIGIKAARGDLIVRLDAHAEYPKDYLHLSIETSQRSGADNVGGVVITLPRSDSVQAKLVQALTTHRFGVGDSKFRLNSAEGPVDTFACGCYKREVFDRIGLFDERLVRNQDYELNRRIIRDGGIVWLNPQIKIFYYNQDLIKDLLRQAFCTGKWNSWMWFIAPYTFALRHAIPAFFTISLICIILLMISFSNNLLLISLLSTYGVFALIASVQQSRRYGWWMIPLLPILFLAYHIAYGLGTLLGALRLIFKNTPVQRK